jgi:hypothetical protein
MSVTAFPRWQALCSGTRVIPAPVIGILPVKNKTRITITNIATIPHAASQTSLEDPELSSPIATGAVALKSSFLTMLVHPFDNCDYCLPFRH